MQGQNITGYRYWFNDDVDAATVVDLAPQPEAEAELVLNSAALPFGHHLATIQFRDADGHWGAPWTEHFTRKGGTVNTLEYWFDDAIGASSTMSITPGEVAQIDAQLDISALPVGFHTVSARTIDAQGERSVPYTIGFARNGGLVTGYEYWIDDAIADRTGGSAGPASVVDLVANLPVPTTDGPHTFTIRFRDADGGWSVPLSSTFNFILGLDEIPGVAEYLVFPNPTTDQLALRLNATEQADLLVSILDATGRTVRDLGNWTALGTVYRNWDISTLSRGSYQLWISDRDRQIRIPFVKQ